MTSRAYLPNRCAVCVCGLASLLAIAACADPATSPGQPDDTAADASGPGGADASAPGDASPTDRASIATELGLTQYAGHITPQVYSQDGDVTSYRFDPAEGPKCLRGGEFYVSARDVGARDVVIYLQFGGVCWSGFCLANNRAQPSIPDLEILNPGLAANPVADWNHVFVPYCDGSLFAGDAEHDDNLNGRGTRYHRGLANLTGALETAKLRFPSPARILLAGSSGGAYGLLIAGFLTRHYYPTAELIVMADAGIGLARDQEPAYLQGLLDEFNLTRFVPADCVDCTDRGHLTGLLGYFLDRVPDVRVGLYSSWYDATLTKLYLDIASERFANALQQQTDRLHQRHPTRFRRFIIDGTQHAMLPGDGGGALGTDWTGMEIPPDALIRLFTSVQIGSMLKTQIDGVTAAAWLAALIDDTPAWRDTLQPRGPAPALR